MLLLSPLSSLSFHFTFSLQFLSTSFCFLLFKPETHTISALPSFLSQINLFPSKKKISDQFAMDSFLTLSLISHLSFLFKACTRAGFGSWSWHGDWWIGVSWVRWWCGFGLVEIGGFLDGDWWVANDGLLKIADDWLDVA